MERMKVENPRGFWIEEKTFVNSRPRLYAHVVGERYYIRERDRLGRPVGEWKEYSHPNPRKNYLTFELIRPLSLSPNIDRNAVADFGGGDFWKAVREFDPITVWDKGEDLDEFLTLVREAFPSRMGEVVGAIEKFVEGKERISSDLRKVIEELKKEEGTR